MKPKALVMRTAGTNCDRESGFALSLAGALTDIYHVNHIRRNCDLSAYQIICIPGGFSYGDDLGAGKILALEINSWFRQELCRFIDKGGLVIGICNGFQVLVRTGLLPDADFRQKITLTLNDSCRFEDRWVYLKVNTETIWFKGLPDIISLPVAHGEGRFYADNDILKVLEAGRRTVLKYVSKDGRLSGYPFNPNGSLGNVAGITDNSGRILGLMPHPERFVFEHHSPFWKSRKVSPYGIEIFRNAVNYFK